MEKKTLLALGLAKKTSCLGLGLVPHGKACLLVSCWCLQYNFLRNHSLRSSSNLGQGFLGPRTWLGPGQVRQVRAPAGFEPARFGLDFDF